MIRKISGKSKLPSFTHLNTKRGTKATSKEEIANTLGETFLRERVRIVPYMYRLDGISFLLCNIPNALMETLFDILF